MDCCNWDYNRGSFLDGVDKAIPHEHFEMGREGASSNLRRIWLFVLAVTIHNFPEGMAVGVSWNPEYF